MHTYIIQEAPTDEDCELRSEATGAKLRPLTLGGSDLFEQRRHSRTGLNKHQPNQLLLPVARYGAFRRMPSWRVLLNFIRGPMPGNSRRQLDAGGPRDIWQPPTVSLYRTAGHTTVNLEPLTILAEDTSAISTSGLAITADPSPVSKIRLVWLSHSGQRRPGNASRQYASPHGSPDSALWSAGGRLLTPAIATSAPLLVPTNSEPCDLSWPVVPSSDLPVHHRRVPATAAACGCFC